MLFQQVHTGSNDFGIQIFGKAREIFLMADMISKLHAAWP